MRLSKGGTAWCHTATEFRALLGDRDVSEFYVDEDFISVEADRGDWSAEVARSDDGEILCYIEADTREKVIALVKELDLELT